MVSSPYKWLISAGVAVIGSIGVYYLQRKQRRYTQTPGDLTPPPQSAGPRSESPKKSPQPAPSEQPPLLPATEVSGEFDGILSLLSKLSLSKSPDPSVLTTLSHHLSLLSEADLADLKAHADYVSFMTSEWVFYHTLRSRKTITWNSTTGVMDEALSPQERVIGEQIANTMRKAYWDKHLEDLNSDPPEYKYVLERLSELGKRMEAAGKEGVWDLELVVQAVAAGKFDRLFFVSIMRRAVETLSDLESPAAHEETAAWFNTRVFSREAQGMRKDEFHKEIVDCLQFLFSRLDVMDAEISNLKSAKMAKDIKRRKEMVAFRSLVQEELIETTQLRSALGKAADATAEEIDGAIVSAVVGSVLAVIDPKSDPATTSVLETLTLDRETLVGFKNRSLHVSALASFLVAMHAQVPLVLGGVGTRFLKQQSAVKAMVGALENEAEWFDELVAHLIQFCAEGELNEENITKLKHAIDQCCSRGNQVRQLYEKRVLMLIGKGLAGEKSDRIPSNAMGSQPWFLSTCAEHLQVLIDEIREFVTEHIHVYLPVYKDVAIGTL